MKLSEIVIMEKEVARFVKTLGPNRTRGFDLQVKDGKFWKSLGFVIDKPKKNKGKLEVYNGARGKSLDVNLSKYTFESDIIDESIITEKKANAVDIAKILKSDDFGMSPRGGNGAALVLKGNLVIRDGIHYEDKKRFDKMENEWIKSSGSYAKYFKEKFGVTFKLVKKELVDKKLGGMTRYYEMILKVI